MTERNGTASASSTSTGSIDNLKDSVKHLVDQGQEKAGEIKNALVGAKQKVVSTGANLIASARAAIVDRPFVAVGIAFGVGYVAMRIFRR